MNNNGTLESSPAASPTGPTPTNGEELTRLKRKLLQTEVRLAKARATVAGAEVDIKVLNSRLKALTR